MNEFTLIPLRDSQTLTITDNGVYDITSPNGGSTLLISVDTTADNTQGVRILFGDTIPTSISGFEVNSQVDHPNRYDMYPGCPTRITRKSSVTITVWYQWFRAGVR